MENRHVLIDMTISFVWSNLFTHINSTYRRWRIFDNLVTICTD